MGIILGTGVGGGLVMGDSLYVGAQGGACEVGHLELYTHGHPCYCGRSGCAEQYLSGPAIEAAYGSRLYAQIKGRVGSAEVFRLARDREPLAIALVGRYRSDLARFLTQLTNAYDPHCFVLGGGVSAEDILYEGIEADVARWAFAGRSPQILRHELGPSSGVLGAALLAIDPVQHAA